MVLRDCDACRRTFAVVLQTAKSVPAWAHLRALEHHDPKSEHRGRIAAAFRMHFSELAERSVASLFTEMAQKW